MVSSRIVPGWSLNVTALLHKAEAILAVTYIFIVHFFIGHLRPSSFPMNEGMFSGSVPLEDVMEEKPAWVNRLKKEGKLEAAMTSPPVLWFRVFYFLFGYAALGFGIYLLVNLIVCSR
ncbi:MAG: cytochrome C, partial [Desulfobacterales bacterium]